MSQQQENGEEPEEPAAQPLYPESGPNREEMASQYLPEREDWDAKTVLSTGDPATLAALDNMGRMYPEVEDLQEIIDDAVETYLRSRTSVAGKSRDEYSDIIKAMFGGGSDDEKSSALQLVAADDDD